MEIVDSIVSRRTHKRKLSEICEDESSRFPLNELNQDLLEKVLSWLPTSSFFRLSSVSKRWKSVQNSATFRLACSQVPSRDPWFFMVDSDSQAHPNHQPIAFDSSERTWKKLNYPPLLPEDFTPVAASGGLICFHRAAAGDFIITNPISGTCQKLNPPFPNPHPLTRAIAITSKAETFKLYLVSGDLPNLTFRQYTTGEWGEEIALTRKTHTTSIESEHSSQYFLSKCGNLVSTNIQRSPSKQYSSILTLKNGEEILHFLSPSGTIVSCNLTRTIFFEYPRLLPVFSEYSIDLVECGGEMYAVLLCEFLESSSLRVWSWDEGVQRWNQIAAMPPFMSHKFYGKKVDINCTGAGDQQMFVCVNSGEMCCYVLCNLVANEWVEVPQCYINGEAKEFASAFSFEPRIEASVQM